MVFVSSLPAAFSGPMTAPVGPMEIRRGTKAGDVHSENFLLREMASRVKA
jgi:hypothetical protein